MTRYPSESVRRFDQQFAESDYERGKRQREARLRRIRPPGECAYCDANRHEPMMPPHTASARCESGKHAHCTCNICF